MLEEDFEEVNTQRGWLKIKYQTEDFDSPSLGHLIYKHNIKTQNFVTLDFRPTVNLNMYIVQNTKYEYTTSNSRTNHQL